MNPGISIRPSKELRNNYNQISSLSRSNPVAITVNGKEDTVVMSHEDFVEQQKYICELEARLAVYALSLIHILFSSAGVSSALR